MTGMGHNSGKVSPIDAINAYIQKDNQRVVEQRGRQVPTVQKVEDLLDGTFQADFGEGTIVRFEVKQGAAQILGATHNPTYLAA